MIYSQFACSASMQLYACVAVDVVQIQAKFLLGDDKIFWMQEKYINVLFFKCQGSDDRGELIY